MPYISANEVMLLKYWAQNSAESVSSVDAGSFLFLTMMGTGASGWRNK